MDLNSELFATLVLGVRCLLLVLATYNAAWSAKWMLRLVRGEGWPITPVKAGIFLVGVGSMALQILVLAKVDTGTDSAFALFAFIALTAGQLAFTIAHRIGWVERFEQAALLLKHSRYTIVVAELAELDEHRSEQLRQRAIRDLAERLLEA